MKYAVIEPSKSNFTTIKVKYDSRKITGKEITKTIEEVGSCENPDAKPYKVSPVEK